LAESTALAKIDKPTKLIRDYIALLTAEWNAAELPQDVRRLAENINGLVELMNLRIEQLKSALDAEKGKGRGSLTQNLSPYGIVLQTLLNEYPDKFKSALTSHNDRRQKVVIPAELLLPADIDRELCRNAIFL
jgi:hypothetical protein